MEQTPNKIAIEFISTAGNYFIVNAEGGFVSLDPNGKFAHELLMRYNNYPNLAKSKDAEIKELVEALRKAQEKIEVAINGIPTGDLRNSFTDCNIELLQLLSKYDKK